MPEETKEVGGGQRTAPEVVRVRSRGQISSSLERYSEIYKKNFPGKATRYVYDPEHKPELSGVLARSAMGYELVTWGEVGVVGDSRRKEGDPVRVGDLVLMGIDQKIKDELRRERRQWAKDKAESVQRKYYEEVEKAAKEGTPGHHSGPAVRPLGRASIKERSFEYEINQRDES